MTTNFGKYIPALERRQTVHYKNGDKDLHARSILLDKSVNFHEGAGTIDGDVTFTGDVNFTGTTTGAAVPALQSVLTVGNNANNIRILNVGAPTTSTDAATKNYVDTWQPLTTNVQTGVTNITNSAVDTVIPGMTITPPAGRYRVSFTSTASNTNNGNTVTFTIYVNGASIVSTVTQVYIPANNARVSVSCETEVSVTGTQAIDVRWSTSANSASVFGRNLCILRMG